MIHSSLSVRVKSETEREETDKVRIEVEMKKLIEEMKGGGERGGESKRLKGEQTGVCGLGNGRT